MMFYILLKIKSQVTVQSDLTEKTKITPIKRVSKLCPFA